MPANNQQKPKPSDSDETSKSSSSRPSETSLKLSQEDKRELFASFKSLVAQGVVKPVKD